MTPLDKLPHQQWPTVAASGHRTFRSTINTTRLRAEATAVARILTTRHGMKTGISGMARGWDLWWAEGVLKAGAALVAYVPYPEQPYDNGWTDQDRALYTWVLSQADRTVHIGASRSVRHLHARNDAMLRDSDALVVCRDPLITKGGTASAYTKAVQRRKPLVIVNPVTGTTTGHLPPPR